ncbi:hypothetical protein BH24ACT15_BH24ACT15_27050 [soil metagenome]
MPMGQFSELKSATIFRRFQDGRAGGSWKLEVRYEGLRPKLSSWPTRPQPSPS